MFRRQDTYFSAMGRSIQRQASAWTVVYVEIYACLILMIYIYIWCVYIVYIYIHTTDTWFILMMISRICSTCNYIYIFICQLSAILVQAIGDDPIMSFPRQVAPPAPAQCFTCASVTLHTVVQWGELRYCSCKSSSKSSENLESRTANRLESSEHGA